MHTLRCTPCDGHPLLGTHDDLLRQGISAICNSHHGDLQWSQTSLSFREGGLKIRRASSLAVSAILASAQSISELQTLILLNYSSGVHYAGQEARARWFFANSTSYPDDECSTRQRSWDVPGIARDWATIWNNCVNYLDRARLLALKATHSSDWLSSFPISSCGLRMYDETIRVAIGLRLGLNLCETHTCPCGATVNVRGTHSLLCQMSTGHRLATTRSTISLGECSNGPMFLPQKNQLSCLVTTGNARWPYHSFLGRTVGALHGTRW